MTHESNTLVMTVEDAAACLGISRSLAYQAARAGEIPTIRIGRRLLVPRVALGRLLDGKDDVRELAGDRLEPGA